MATYDLTSDGSSLNPGADPFFKIQNTVDFQDSRITTALAAADILQVLSIPDKVYVMAVFCEVITASTATTFSIDIGDGTDPNGYDAAVDAKGTAGTITVSAEGTDALVATGGTIYGSTDTIDIDPNTITGTADGVVKITAVCMSVA